MVKKIIRGAQECLLWIGSGMIFYGYHVYKGLQYLEERYYKNHAKRLPDYVVNDGVIMARPEDQYKIMLNQLKEAQKD